MLTKHSKKFLFIRDVLVIFVVVFSMTHYIIKVGATTSYAFQKTFGWGVQDGSSAFQICTSGCRAGIAGSGVGQFNYPASIAVDHSGNIYVANNGASATQKFAQNGTYTTSFSFAGAMAFDASDNIYVTNAGLARIEEYDSSGAFIKTFGWGVQDGTSAFQICTSGCQSGIAGGGNGQFSGIGYISVDSSGNIYVPDWNYSHVQRFNSDGTFSLMFGGGGAGDGQFSISGSVVADASGNMYVTDEDHNRIEKFDSSGTFLRTWGWGVQDGTSAFQICTSGCQAGIGGAGFFVLACIAASFSA